MLLVVVGGDCVDWIVCIVFVIFVEFIIGLFEECICNSMVVVFVGGDGFNRFMCVFVFGILVLYIVWMVFVMCCLYYDWCGDV